MDEEKKITAQEDTGKNTSSTEKEEAPEIKETEETAETEINGSETERKKSMKNDRQYRRGRHIYAFGTWLMLLYLLGFAARQLIGIDIIIGDMFVSVYMSLLVIVPISLMIIGMSVSQKAAERYSVDEKNKPWIGVLSIAGVVMIALAVFEIIMPSYKVYDLSVLEHKEGSQTVRPSQELVVTEYFSGTIFNPAPETKPGYTYIDVYAKYGIFAVRKVTAANNHGSYEISPGTASDDYVLTVTSVGHDEQFRFTY